MAANARMSTNWAWRMGIVSSVFAGFALWCLYDAKVGYPRFNQRAAEYNRLHAAGQTDRWPTLAAEQGWSATFRKEEYGQGGAIGMKTSWDIGTQYVMMGGCLVVVGLILFRLQRARRRTMGADDSGFRTIEGTLVPYGEITAIDLSRWQRKSIARVHFRQGGRQLTTDIDDWIYQGGDTVLAEVQRRTGLGAPPARPPGAAGSASASGESHDKPDVSAS